MSQTCTRILLVWAGLVVTADAQEAVNLAYKHAKGDKLGYRITAAVDSMQEIAGMKVQNKINTEQWVVHSVDKVDDKGTIHLTAETNGSR